MAGVTIVVKVEGPDDMKGSELRRMVTKALGRIETKQIRVLETEMYRTSEYEDYFNYSPTGRAVRKTVKTKEDKSNGSA